MAEDNTNDPPALETELFCPDCGYSLRGIESDRCPECGLAIDRLGLGVSRIPWLHRGWIGFAPALWRTIWMVIRRPGMLGAECSKPVSLAQAQRFRWVIVILACIPLGGAAILWRILLDPSDAPPGLESLMYRGTMGVVNAPDAVDDLLLCFWAGALLWPVPIAGIFLFWAGATGVASYLFHPRSLPVVRPNRAVALSYYACAPLAHAFVVAMFVGALLLVQRFGSVWPRWFADWLLRWLAIGCAAATVMIALTWWLSTLRILSRSTDRSAGRVVVAGAVIPMLWGLLLLLTCFVLPTLIGLVWLMLQSYWG